MRMHMLAAGRLRMRRRTFYADAGRDETIELPVSSVLLRHPKANVLFDTGFHPDAARDPEARWGGLAKVTVPLTPPSETVIGSLGEIGLMANDIDLVICSHLHPDHCGCNSFFTGATVIVHAEEIRAARAQDAVSQGYFPQDWDQPMPLHPVDAQHDLFGDNRVVLLPMPGHTRGSLAAMVELDRSGSFLLASDAAPMRHTLDTGAIPRNTWDADKAAASLDEIRRIAARGTAVIFGHDLDQWQGLKKGADAYE